MRGWLELVHDEHGRISGSFTREGERDPAAFSGWLELLRVLESGLPVDGVDNRARGSDDPRKKGAP